MNYPVRDVNVMVLRFCSPNGEKWLQYVLCNHGRFLDPHVKSVTMTTMCHLPLMQILMTVLAIHGSCYRGSTINNVLI